MKRFDVSSNFPKEMHFKKSWKGSMRDAIRLIGNDVGAKLTLKLQKTIDIPRSPDLKKILGA